MGVEHRKPDYLLIDINDVDELIYIAAKLGCDVSDIYLAVETLKTHRRADVYSWLVDEKYGHTS